MTKKSVTVIESVTYYRLSTAAKLLGTTVKNFTEIAGIERIDFRNFKENGPLMVRADDLKRIMHKFQIKK